MVDEKLQSKISKIDSINNSLRMIILQLYNDIRKNDLDNETMAFLINIVESIESERLELQNLNVELIKDYLTPSAERSSILCQSIIERDAMEKEYKKLQIKAAEYLDSKENIEDANIIRH